MEEKQWQLMGIINGPMAANRAIRKKQPDKTAKEKKIKKREKRKEKEKEPCAKPHPPYHRPTYCDPTARMNGASRSDWPMEVTKCGWGGTKWNRVEHSARRDHDHQAWGGSSVGWNRLEPNARSDTGGRRCVGRGSWTEYVHMYSVLRTQCRV